MPGTSAEPTGRRLPPGAVVIATVTAVTASLCAVALASPAPSFAYRTLAMPGSAVAYFPSVATGSDGSAMVMTAGPVVWRSPDGRSWSAGTDTVNPATCSNSNNGGVGSPPAGVILPDQTLVVGQACASSDSSLDVFRSLDHGSSWQPTSTPGGVVLPVTDGGFVSRGPGGAVYAVASSGADLTTLVVRRSDDGGDTWGAPSVVNRGLTDNCTPQSVGDDGCVTRNVVDEGPDFYTPVVTDPSAPNRAYVAWWTDDLRDVAGGSGLVTPWEHSSKLFVARTDDEGATWSTRLVLDTGDSNPLDNADTNDLGNWAPTATVDSAGNVYVAVARRGPGNTETHVELLSSRDHGVTWSKPVKIDRGLGSTFGPQLAAVGRGHVDVAFYGTAGTDETDPGDVWDVYLDDVRLGAPGRSDQQLVARSVHQGAICPQGGGSPVSSFPQCTDRAHLTVGLAVARDGHALLAYVNDNSGKSVLTVAREVG